MDRVLELTKNDLKTDLPDFKSGDTIEVGVKVIEGSRSRVQVFEGVVIAISSNNKINKTFTIRKISNGVGVERIFPINLPAIQKIEVNSKGKVKQSKIYYFKKLTGKKPKIKEE